MHNDNKRQKKNGLRTLHYVNKFTRDFQSYFTILSHSKCLSNVVKTGPNRPVQLVELRIS